MEDRRKDRCELRPAAVAKQLETVVRAENLDILIVVGDQGDLVGKNESANADEANELALFGADALHFRKLMTGHLSVDDSVGVVVRRPQLRGLAVRYLDFRGNRLAIVARAQESVIDPGSLDRAVAGVDRILEAADLRKKVAGSNAS